MIYFGVENNIIPKIGKYYAFLAKEENTELSDVPVTRLHVGECVKNEGGYPWAMKDLNDGKIYYPYCSQVLDLDPPLMSGDWVRSTKYF